VCLCVCVCVCVCVFRQIPCVCVCICVRVYVCVYVSQEPRSSREDELPNFFMPTWGGQCVLREVWWREEV
jgi:hypothetical protein